MLRKLTVVFLLAAVPLVAMPTYVQAAAVFSKGVCNRERAQKSSVCEDENTGGSNPLSGGNGVLITIANILTIIVGIAAVISIVLAGLKYVTSGSNPDDVKNARERIIYAVVALIVVALSQLLVRFIIGKVA